MSAEFVKHVAIFGTESTGKSSLAEKLAAHFGEPWSAEYVREFWNKHEGRIVAEDLAAIARGQIIGEDAAAARAKRVVFHDTDLLTHVLWADLLFPGRCPSWVRTEADMRSRRMALYLVCAAGVPFVDDPQRVFRDEVERQRSAVLWRRTLEQRGLRIVDVSGDWAERDARAIAAVGALLTG